VRFEAISFCVQSIPEMHRRMSFPNRKGAAMIWISGKELLEPPHNLTKIRLWELVEVGSLIPYDDSGKWRVVPSEKQADYDRLRLVAVRAGAQQTSQYPVSCLDTYAG
jgi:hypothetical protein